MNFTASIIAEFLKGKVEGDPEAKVSDVSKIEEGKPGTLSFLANPKYEKFLYDTQASIVIVNQDLNLQHKTGATLIRVQNAYEAFAAALIPLRAKQTQEKRHQQAIQYFRDIHAGRRRLRGRIYRDS